MKKKFYFVIILLLSIHFSCTNKTTKEEKDTKTAENHQWTDCQNCGMPTNDFPNWQVSLRTNSKNINFCTPRCMFIHLADSSNNTNNSIKKIEVTDYYTTQKIDGKTAFYVTGSDKTSTMGKDFVPFSKKGDAQSFMQEHNGKKIYPFDEITKEVVVSELK